MHAISARMSIWTLSALTLASTVFAQAPPNREVDPNVFPSITPSADLEWHDCYDVYKCARLSVPAQVHAPKNKQPCKDRVEIAIIRLPYRPANASMPNESHGTVHIQLGGWSASSTNFLVRFGESYTELFAGYDLLAIDYRGYGWSTPAINCFTSEEERQAFAAAEPPLLRASDRSHIDVWEARARDFAQRCRENASRVIRYGGSYAAAIDHVTVMKAMGQDKMSFWAVTSGAVVAQTVAFLYPQYVDKFLLDAPAAAGPDYTTTTATAKTIEDSNTALSAFLYTCLNADPQGSTPCNITGNSTTLPAIRARFDKIEADLRAYPDGTGLNVPSLPPGKQFTWSVFKYVETIALFVPSLFPLFAGVLAEVESGRLVGFVPFAAANLTYQPLPPLPVLTEDTSYYGLSIGACTDAARPLRSREAFDAYYADIEGQGPAVAPLFGTAPMFCKEWRVPTVNRYRGPLQVSGSELAKCGGKVVIVNNVADSASSLSNAREVRDAFGGGGSAVAVVESVAVGHTSFVAASACLFKVIAELFAAGIVPADGTRCEGIFSPPFGVQLPSDFSG